MIYLNFPILLLLLFSSTVNADIPYTFTSGTKAKASEVNANFEYLNSKIASIRTELEGDESNQSLAETEPFTCVEQRNDYPYTYSFIDAALGTSIYVAGDEYRISKFPVIDHQGSVFHVTMPLRVSSQSTPTSTTYVKSSPFTYEISADEYICDGDLVFGDAKFYSNKPTGFVLAKQYYYSNDGDDDSHYSYDTALVETISYIGNIAIGSSYMTISISSTPFSYESLVTNDDYDFTDNIPDRGAPDYSAEIAELSAYLNHIKIERITQ